MAASKVESVLSGLEIEFARNPKLDSARRLVDCYLESVRYVEALVVARRCVRQWPENPESHALLCEVYLARGNQAKLSDTLDKVPDSCHITTKLEGYARLAGHPLAQRLTKEPYKPPESKPEVPAPAGHETTKQPPVLPATESPTVVRPEMFLPPSEPTGISAPKPRPHKTLFLFSGLAIMLGAYIGWTWSFGQDRQSANRLILEARRNLRHHTEQGYRKALEGFRKALDEIEDDPPALVGACWTAAVLAGEYDGYRHLLDEAKEYLRRARAADISVPRLSAARALLEAYGGHPGNGMEVLQAYQADIDRSSILLDAMARIELMSGQASRAAARSGLAVRHNDLRLLLAVARAAVEARRYNTASSLLDAASRLAPGHSEVESIRKDIAPFLAGPRNVK